MITCDMDIREDNQERPPRYSYHLTEKGQDLGPVLQAMLTWGNTYISGTLSRQDTEKLFKQQGT